MAAPSHPAAPLILYDAQCPFCTFWAVFIARRDSGRHLFVPIASPHGHKLCKQLHLNPTNPGTFALITPQGPLFRSQGILAIFATLPGYGWAVHLRHLPLGLRNRIYTFIARTRYALFGRYPANKVPPALKNRLRTSA